MPVHLPGPLPVENHQLEGAQQMAESQSQTRVRGMLPDSPLSLQASDPGDGQGREPALSAAAHTPAAGELQL